MHQQTRQLFRGYQDRIAQLNGIPAEQVRGGESFTVTPVQDQRIREAVALNSPFLSQVNQLGVDNQIGEAIDLGVSTLAGRTKTSGVGAADRVATDPSSMTSDSYEAKQTNFDSALPYIKLDAWRHNPNFQSLWSQSIVKQIGRDMIMAGWHGTSAADTTDRTANPLLQDVAIGWLQKMRAGNAGRWLTRGAAHAGETRVGTATGADYRNIDHLANELALLLHPAYRQDPDLVCLIGLDLIQDKYTTFFAGADGDAPTEREALERMMLNRRVGQFRAMVAPFFPDRAMLITTLRNLSVYTQNGTRRRTIVDNTRRDQVEDFQSVNMAYVIERFESAAGCENIIFAGEETWT